MDKNKFWVVLLAMSVLLFAGCDSDNQEGPIKEDDPDRVEEIFCKLLDNRDIGGGGGTFRWAVKTNKSWSLDPDELDEWLTIDPLKGRAGTTDVVLEVEVLPDGQERTAELPFLLGDKVINITVKQTPDGREEEGDKGPVCRLIDQEIFGKVGGEMKCILEASADWTLSGELDWLTVSPTEGKAGQTTLTLTAEPTEILRAAVLTFILEGRTAELVVCQNLLELLSPEFVWWEVRPPFFKGGVAPVNEIQPSECGFAYKEKGAGDDTWTFVSIDTEMNEYGVYNIETNIELETEKSYIVRIYAKLKDTVFFFEEAKEVN